MQAGSLRRLMTVLLGCVFLAQTMAIALFLYRTQPLAETEEQIGRGHMVRAELLSLLSAVLDAETGQRGFVITGLEEFLQPYRASAPTLRPRLEQLRGLSGGEPALGQTLDALQPLIVALRERMAHSIEVRRHSGLEPAVQLVTDGTDRETMDQIRALITERLDSEQRRISLGERTHLRERAREIKLAFFGLYGTLLLTGILGLYLLHRLGSFGRSLERRTAALSAPLVDALALSTHERRALTALAGSQAIAGAEAQAALEIVSRMARDLSSTAIEITSSIRAIAETSADTADAATLRSESGRLLKLAARTVQLTLSLELTTSEQRRLLGQDRALVTRLEESARDSEQIAERIGHAIGTLSELRGEIPSLREAQSTSSLDAGLGPRQTGETQTPETYS